MRLLPREEDRLLLFLAAELARRRRDRGLKLTQAEASAIIADEVSEAARDGVSYEEAVARGYAVLGEEDVLEGVADLLPQVELEAGFLDGSRLVVLRDPIRADGPPEASEPEVTWLDDAGEVTELEIVNEGEVPVGVTSHFHVFEVNRNLRFDRRAAWGRRLAVAPGVKVFFLPGEPRTVRLVPFAGERVVRGHGGLVDGPLDAPGALDAALAQARELGYRGA
jgi:urease subunit gamma/beta